MMKRIMMFAFALLLVGAFAHAAGTTTSTAKTTATKTMATKAPKIEGTIQSIDTAKHTVTVMVGTEARTFTLSSHTEYMANGKKSRMADLKVGSKVSIEADSKNNARVIDIEQ